MEHLIWTQLFYLLFIYSLLFIECDYKNNRPGLSLGFCLVLYLMPLSTRQTYPTACLSWLSSFILICSPYDSNVSTSKSIYVAAIIDFNSFAKPNTWNMADEWQKARPGPTRARHSTQGGWDILSHTHQLETQHVIYNQAIFICNCAHLCTIFSEIQKINCKLY